MRIDRGPNPGPRVDPKLRSTRAFLREEARRDPEARMQATFDTATRFCDGGERVVPDVARRRAHARTTAVLA